ncbi:MAG: LysM peptidoglycan-binding domain-containing protein [Acidobacteria bacterium]|nr:LysM peptidoglycan-binding domain-containing protein [Acidobacteriota bacterium]
MKRTTWFVILVSLLPALVVAGGVAPPPKPLHKVGQHWTPYTPPSTFPKGAKVHVIKKGDTLWDLAQQYLGNSYLWPQIWERNPYIRDSHWIYPGDPLVVDIAVAKAPAPKPAPSPTPVAQVTPALVKPAAAPVGEAIPLGNTSDVYCFAILNESGEAYPFRVMSAEKGPYQDSFSEGDIIYINGGTAEGVRAGDRFFVLESRGELRHPVSGASMGKLYRQVGQIKVLCAQKHSSICEIVNACDPVVVGNVLKPFKPIPVPLAIKTPPKTRCDAPNGKPTGVIAYMQDGTTMGGDSTLVMLDLGSADGIYPGMFVTIYRDNPAVGMPRLVLGEAGILTTGQHYSTAKILSAKASIHVGDHVEVK